MQEPFISGVHNYCDRWCERCPFTARCEVFAAEQEMSDEAKDPTNPAFWENLKKSFEDILDMLNQKMAELGIEVDEDAAPPAEPPAALVALKAQMREEAMRYATAVDAFFKQNTDYFEGKGQELAEQVEDGVPVDLERWQFLQDAVEVVQWYQFFIPAKIDRAVGGLAHEDEEDDVLQSDANGTAKVAMLALDRSLDAWEMIRGQFTEKADEIEEMQRHLQGLRTKMDELFPNWRVFHRPGFDDEPGNTMRLDFNPN